jgi:hypothetical protein
VPTLSFKTLLRYTLFISLSFHQRNVTPYTYSQSHPSKKLLSKTFFSRSRLTSSLEYICLPTFLKKLSARKLRTVFVCASAHTLETPKLSTCFIQSNIFRYPKPLLLTKPCYVTLSTDSSRLIFHVNSFLRDGTKN